MIKMQIEVLVYVYMTICLFMMLFNIVSLHVMRCRAKVSRKKEEQFTQSILKQIQVYKEGGTVTEQHRRELLRSLRFSGNLLTYMQTAQALYLETPEQMRSYMCDIGDVFSKLIPYYTKKKDVVLYAFYLYVLKVYCSMSGKTETQMTDVMLKALTINNTYCRENALRAIYSLGKEEMLLEALLIIDENETMHNKKLLTEGILSFRGNHKKLFSLLILHFERFSVQMQTIILDCIRFDAQVYSADRVLDIMCDEKRNNELRFSCIRFFAKYPNNKAYPTILAFAQGNNHRWEYAAIATSALSSYPGSKSMQVLKHNLSSPNWYIRFNAGESLLKLGADYFDLMDIADGEDRFAREIVQFMLDVRHNRIERASKAV